MHAPLPQESWGLGYYSKLLRFTNPYTSLLYHSTLAFELLCARVSYPQTFVFLLRFTCQYYYPRVRCEFTDNFTVSFTENMTHAQTVCTRPFLLLLKGPGDKANYCESLNSRPSVTPTIHLHFVSYILHKFSIDFVSLTCDTNHLLS